MRDKAIEYYEKVIELSPDYSWAYYNLASIYFEQGDKEKAVNFLEKTLKLNPKDSEASVVFAKIMAKESHFNEAEKIMIDARL